MEASPECQTSGRSTSGSQQVAQGAFAAIKLIGLSPQRISLELPERGLDSCSSLWIRIDFSRSKRGAAEQAKLATEKEPAARKEGISRNVSQGGRFQQGCYIGDRF
jgi:hypothetical protein